jgi:hypothetical protein
MGNDQRESGVISIVNQQCILHAGPRQYLRPGSIVVKQNKKGEALCLPLIFASRFRPAYRFENWSI